MTPPEPSAQKPLFTRPPLVVVIVSVLLILFALVAPAAPGFRAVTVFAALMLLLLVRDRDPATTAAGTATQPPPPPRHVPAPNGTSRVDVNAPGLTPTDVAWVWHQFRALDPAEQRTLEEFTQALRDSSTSGDAVTAAVGISARAADDLAAALRRAGADVDVSTA